MDGKLDFLEMGTLFLCRHELGENKEPKRLTVPPFEKAAQRLDQFCALIEKRDYLCICLFFPGFDLKKQNFKFFF